MEADDVSDVDEHEIGVGDVHKRRTKARRSVRRKSWEC